MSALSVFRKAGGVQDENDERQQYPGDKRGMGQDTLNQYFITPKLVLVKEAEGWFRLL